MLLCECFSACFALIAHVYINSKHTCTTNDDISSYSCLHYTDHVLWYLWETILKKLNLARTSCLLTGCGLASKGIDDILQYKPHATLRKLRNSWNVLSKIWARAVPLPLPSTRHHTSFQPLNVWWMLVFVCVHFCLYICILVLVCYILCLSIVCYWGQIRERTGVTWLTPVSVDQSKAWCIGFMLKINHMTCPVIVLACVSEWEHKRANTNYEGVILIFFSQSSWSFGGKQYKALFTEVYEADMWTVTALALEHGSKARVFDIGVERPL